MRKIVSWLLILIFLLSGCHSEEAEKTVLFYYPRVNYTQNSTDSVVAPEERNNEGFSTTAMLLDQYLQGPLDPLLHNPFPSGTKVVEVYIMGNVTLVTLTDAFAQLSGLDFALACASISRTVSGITGTPMVQIDCETVKLNGSQHITITPDTYLYLDDVPAAPETTATEETS